ncbi:YdcF family protein [Mammaliicoccus sciuri]|uniref:YdcF family protein n=1 Tax=Mammaliicoccus sciuri TaxID=1296 RepID=UPI003F55A438
MIYIILISILIVLITCLYIIDRRSLKFGLTSIFSIFIILAIIILSIEDLDVFNNVSYIGLRLVYLVIVLFSILLLIGPTLLIFILIIKGIELLKKEGTNFRNLLSLITGIFLLFNNILSAKLLSILSDYSIWYYGYILITIFVYYLLFLSSIYTISSWINFINLRQYNLNYIIILGAGLIGDKVTPILASRINKGIEIYKRNPNSKIIMSGGQGDDELIAESQAMKNYAISLGIPSQDIIIENQSKNTEENLTFSNKLIPNTSKVAIVTNYYHLFRALVIAKDKNIRCIGYGAKTKLYFSLNAFIREFIGYLYLKRKFHLVIIIIFTIVYIPTVIFVENYIR